MDNKIEIDWGFEKETIELPSLTGSEKQIAWANKIRAKSLDIAFTSSWGVKRARELALVDSAAWWINLRNAGVAEMIRVMLKDK